MIKKFCIIICWFVIIVCTVSIFIVIATGGINLFSIGDFHVYIRGIRRPTGFLVLFSVLLLYFRKRDIKSALIALEKGCTERFAWMLLGIFSLLFIWIKISQHLAFGTGAYDLSMFDYAIFNTLKGNFMYTPMLERNFFSEHFSPILLFFVPLYLIYAGPSVLLITQALATALSGYFIYRLARREIDSMLAPILLMVAYLGNKSLTEGFWFDFHIELFEPLFILGAFYFFKIRRYLWYWVFIMLAITCKEDVAIYTFTLGLYIWIFEKNIKIGLKTCILSLLWIILAWKIVIPLSYPEKRAISHFLSRWSEFGNTYTGIAINLIQRPGLLCNKLFSGPSIKLFFPLLFLPLLSPSKLIMVIPPLLLNLISNYEPQANLSLHYSVPIIPFLWMAGIYGLKRLRYKWLIIVMALLLCAINFGHYRFYNIDSHAIKGHKIIKMIPDGVPVSIQSCFAPHIPHRDSIWIFPKVENAEYILVDIEHSYWPMTSKKDLYKELKEYLSSKQWEILIKEDGYKLLKRRFPVDSINY